MIIFVKLHQEIQWFSYDALRKVLTIINQKQQAKILCLHTHNDLKQKCHWQLKNQIILKPDSLLILLIIWFSCITRSMCQWITYILLFSCICLMIWECFRIFFFLFLHFFIINLFAYSTFILCLECIHSGDYWFQNTFYIHDFKLFS